MVIGVVVLVVYVGGICFGVLWFSGELFVDIYLGKICKWNDCVIVVLNLELVLLVMNIIVVYWVELLGMSYLWCEFFGCVSVGWCVLFDGDWFVGVVEIGNEGVVVLV